jgi:hypothetical protein
MSSAGPKLSPPGWYSDPGRPGASRYWTGHAWGLTDAEWEAAQQRQSPEDPDLTREPAAGLAGPLEAPAGWYNTNPSPYDRRHDDWRYWDGSQWLAPPGYYPDPERPNTWRQWNGQEWERHEDELSREDRKAQRGIVAVWLGAFAWGTVAFTLLGPSEGDCPSQEWSEDFWMAMVPPWLVLLFATVTYWIWARSRGNRSSRQNSVPIAIVTAILNPVLVAFFITNQCWN